jgi:hypothetical protein
VTDKTLAFIVWTAFALAVVFIVGLVALVISGDVDTSCPAGTTWESGPAVPTVVGKVIVLQYPSAGCR